MNKAHRKHPDPEWAVGSSSGQIRNKHLLTVDRSKDLPRLRQNQSFWRGRKRTIVIVVPILVALVAGIIIGVVIIAISKKHHTDPSSPSSASSSANPSNSAAPIPLSTSSSSSSSPPTSIPGRQPIPATLATAFRSSSWIWLGAQALTGVPGGNWAFRKTLPTSTAPATQAVALLTVDNGFQLYHNGQLIAMKNQSPVNASTDTVEAWQTATAVYVKLDPNSNVFAILAQNLHSETDINGPSSAGLLASIQITYADGTTTTISSDDTWRVIQPVPDGFQAMSFNDAHWQSATVLVESGSGPWGGNVTIPESYNITAL